MPGKESLQDVFANALDTALREKLNGVETQEDLNEALQSIDVTSLFIQFLDKTSEGIFHSMKTTMFEEVMKFRADEQEFIAHQEQKWFRAFAASDAMYIMTLEAAETYSEYVQKLNEEERVPHAWTYLVFAERIIPLLKIPINTGKTLNYKCISGKIDAGFYASGHQISCI